MAGETCEHCGSLVYQAESITAGNRVYHKACFKCTNCSKLLSSNSAHLHTGKIHCRTCHAQAIRPPSPALFTDTSKIKPQRAEEGCPNCGGVVFEAEKVGENGKYYHKKCFICCKCRRPQDDKLQVFVGFDKNVYCASCYPNIQHTPLSGSPGLKSILDQDGSGCPRCGGKVFQAEQIRIKSGVYHKTCFLCQLCSRPLDASSCTEHDGKVFCITCYRRNFDVRSRSVGPGSTSVIKAGNGAKCPRCEGIVFEAEKVLTKVHHYHKSCLSCAYCKKGLNATNFMEAQDRDIYCKVCYAVLFGHRRAKSVGPSDTKLIQAPEGDKTRCLRCGGKVYAAEKMAASNGCYHTSCFKCHRCSQILDYNSFNSGAENKIFCNGCFYKKKSVVELEYPKSLVDTTSILADQGVPGCPRCGGKVFEAEKMAAKAGIFHKRCFTCDTCARLLDYMTACDGPKSDLYCQPCFKKKFHISELRIPESEKAFDTSIIKPNNNSEGCPRCRGAVYKPEEISIGGKIYHKGCLRCFLCTTHLSGLTATVGNDRQIYCKSCHSSVFQQPGYQTADVTAVKGEPGDTNTCIKCGGVVYQLEKISSGNLVYHKTCFNCQGCSKKLDSTLVYAFEAPDERVYCKKCYSAKFGAGTTPKLWADTTTIQPKDGKGCPRCGGAVFKAEEIVEKGKNFHLRCFTCKTCNRPQLDKMQVFVGFDGEIYCKGCYPQIMHTQIGLNTDTSIIKGNQK